MKRIFWIIAGSILVIPVFADVQFQTSFDTFTEVNSDIYVYDKTLFSPYNGPDVSQWDKIYKEEPDDPSFDRKRLGIILLSKHQRAYVDLLRDPLSKYYQFIDTKTGKLIFERSYTGTFGELLFNGQGVFYEKFTPVINGESLCTKGTEIIKFEVTNSGVVGVGQPFIYWDNVTSSLRDDTSLYFSHSVSSKIIAKLKKDTTVRVLTSEDGWFLVLTPLGLTGWVPGDRENSTLSILWGCR